jgi:hypothetical protein
MSEECAAVTVEDDVLVETWSGDEINKICNLRGHPTARHNVRVINLRLYSAKRIKCEGIIEAAESVVRFLSDNPSDTASYWTASISGLGSGLQYTFNPCVLQAVEGTDGKEKIRTVATVDWYSTKKQIISLNIDVSTS